MKKRGGILLALVFAFLLSGCGADGRQTYEEGFLAGYDSAREQIHDSYDNGYDDGYADGFDAAAAEAEKNAPVEEPPPADGVESGEDTEPVPSPSEPEEGVLPPGFVSLADAVPDVILEIRYYSAFNFVGERIRGYEEPVAILTEEAARALAAASRDLAEQGYRIKIYDAYRPQSAVEHFKEWALDESDTRMQAYFYPELSKAVLFEEGYISARSGHSRGSTVDLTLVDMETGRDVDMGGGFDYFGERSHPDYEGLTAEQRENRRILREAMTENGFRGISTEWWHFILKNEPFPETYFDFPVAVP